MKLGDKSPEDTIFPVPPQEPRAVDFWLERNVWIKTRTRDTTRYDDFVAQLGGLGSRKSESPVSGVIVDAVKKVWIPEDEEKTSDKGRWKQVVTFKSVLHLNCAPTFTSEAVKMSVSITFSNILIVMFI